MTSKQTALLLVALLVTAGPSPAQSPVAPLRVFGFGDFGYVVSERDIPSGFRAGQLAIHGVAGLTPRLAAFGEISARPVSSGLAVDIERLILRQDFSDFFKLSAGRYHTPISYWNTAYHHGRWLQTTVDRPQMIRFGGTLLPVHFVGLLAEGSLPRHALAPSYSIGVGNGRHQNLARAGDAGDVNGDRAVLASAHVRPRGLFGMSLGGSIYIDQISQPELENVNERIASAHFAWETGGPEVMAEYARVAHRGDLTGNRSNATAGYVQIGYRLPAVAASLKPYVRIEQVSIGAEPLVPSFAELEYRGGVAGIRYDFAQVAALKLELRQEQYGGSAWARSLFLQLSFAVGPTDDSHGVHLAAAPSAVPTVPAAHHP